MKRNNESSGYSLLICNCDEQVRRCIDNITLLESRLIDGFIFQPPETTNASPEQLHDLQEKLKTCQTPYVILDRAIHDVYHDYVAADHQLGGYLATEHLYKLGHRRIGCITGSLSDYGSKRRLIGYQDVLKRYGISIPQDLSLVGYDDSSIANLCSVPLTTIRQPIELLGKRACEILLGRIENNSNTHQDYFYPPALIQRSSCSLPNSKGRALL